MKCVVIPSPIVLLLHMYISSMFASELKLCVMEETVFIASKLHVFGANASSAVNNQINAQ